MVRSKSKNTELETFQSGFLIFKAKLAFTKLRETFDKTLILYYFDLKSNIRIEIDISNYIINRVFSKLTLNNLG